MEEKDELFHLVDLKTFSESGRAHWIDGTNDMWVQQYPFDSWDHPLWGVTTIGVEEANKLKSSFDSGVRGQRIHSDFEHGLDKAKGKKASGEIKELKVIEEPRGIFTQPGLWARVSFTEEAKKEIEDGAWNYWSASHYDTWTHPQEGTKHKMVYAGGGLTNEPWVKDMVPLNFSELAIDESIREFAALTAAARKSLPDGAFMYKAPDGTRMFPYKHADGSLDTNHLQKIVQLAPRASVPDDVKTRVINKAKRLLGAKNHNEQMVLMDVELNKFSSEEVMTEDALIEAIPVDVVDEVDNEGGDTDVELEKELRTLLGLDADADLIASVKSIHDEVTPMREALKGFSEKKAFAEQYPKEFERLERLERESQEAAARKFAESFAEVRLKKMEGDKEEATTLGYSGLVVQKIQETAKMFSEGTADLNSVKDLLDAIQNNGIVDYGTKGSSREDEELLFNEEAAAKGTMQNVRRQFAELVTKTMREDGIKDIVAATRITADKHPKLAEAYHGAGMDRE